MVALREELVQAEVLRMLDRGRGIGPEAEAVLAEPRVEPALPAALPQEVVDRRDGGTAVGDVHPGQVGRLAGGQGREKRAVLAEERGPVADAAGDDVFDRAAGDVEPAPVRVEQPLRPARADDAVVLDQRDVWGRRRKDTGRPQLGHRHRLVEREQLHRGPPLAHLLPGALVGPVGDDHLGVRAVLLERVKAGPEVRESVHGGDDDRELGSGHRRSMSKCPRASA